MRNEVAVHLTNGDQLMFYFERTGRGMRQRSEFERWLNEAAAAAQRNHDASHLASLAANKAPPAEKKRRLETREKKGAELRELLKEVSRLRDRGKL